VKLIKTETNKFVFHISQREKHLLFDLLKLYPLVRSDYQPLSKTAEPVQMKVDQQLLEDALSAQKLENKKELEKFLKEQKRFSEHKGGYRFGLDIHQMEWLLQILNDIRVGNWLLLGSPEPAQTKGLKVNERNAPHVWAMEISGYFQMVLLDAFNR
jgi:hypothetical protein